MFANTPSRVYHISDSNTFYDLKDTTLLNNQTFVVCFSAQWCGPCKVMAKYFDKWSVEYPQVVFVKIDIDEVPTLANEYEVSSIPTTFVMRPYQNPISYTGVKNDIEKALSSPFEVKKFDYNFNNNHMLDSI